MNDEFILYDLRVEVVEIRGKSQTMGLQIGDYFEVVGENLFFPQNKGFSMYNLAAILPLLPAKQRQTHLNDWMTTDAFVNSVDANCGAIFKITRTNKRVFRHSETSGEIL